MGFTYHRWVDFGPTGIRPSEVTLQYKAAESYTLPTEDRTTVNTAWESLVNASEGLHDAPGFNVVEVDDNSVVLGATRFRDHFIRRLSITDDDRLNEMSITPDGLETLHESVHLLSSFVAVIADGHLILGVKPSRSYRGSMLSFPGSGYLDRREDMRGDMIAPVDDLVGREIREELNFSPAESDVHCIGIFEDTQPDSHLNPALFSIVELDLPPDDLRSRALNAPDVDEFERLMTLPLTGEAIESVVGSLTDVTGAPDARPRLFDSIDRISHKSLLMLLLVGRRYLGAKWFTNFLSSSADISVRDDEIVQD